MAVAKHLAGGRIHLNRVPVLEIANEHGIGRGLKDAAILCFLLTQLFLSLNLLGDVTHCCQYMGLAFIDEWSSMRLNKERGAILAQAFSCGLERSASFESLLGCCQNGEIA